MRDDLDFNIEFIEMIKNRPCLYDFNRSDYTNRNIQDVAWQDISKNVNETVADCRERWKNLRGCYTRHLKNKNRPSGSAKRIRPYYLSNHLQFLDSFTKPRTRKGCKMEVVNVEVDRESQDEVEDEEDSLEFDISTSSIVKEEGIWGADLIKKAKVSSCDPSASPVAYYQPKAKLTKFDENRDPDVSFLYSLLPDVSEMNPEQKRRFKIGVLKLASEILQEDNAVSSNDVNSES